VHDNFVAHDFWKTCSSKFFPIRRLYCLYNHIPATSAEVERVWAKCGYLTAKLRNSTKPSTLTRQIFLEKNRPFIIFSGVVKDDNSTSISTEERKHSPLNINLSLLEKAKLTKLSPDSPVEEEEKKEGEKEKEEDIEDVYLKDSESESDLEDDDEDDILEHLHPAEVHFRVSRAPKNFWNQLSQLPVSGCESSSSSSSSFDGGEDEYEISASSNKRIPKEQLRRTSKRFKPLQNKLALLKLRTRVRVWWTELEDNKPRWFVGTVRKHCSPNEFKIVYDHEIEEAKLEEDKKEAEKGWKHDFCQDLFEILLPGEDLNTKWPNPKK